MKIKYAIKYKIVTKPEIELPEGSLPVSVKHHGEYSDDRSYTPQKWQVIWLEPVKK